MAAAVLRLAGGGLVILSGTRHDPLGYDVRLEVFGTRDSLVAGLDAAHAARRDARRARPTRDFWDRFEPAYRAELAAFVDERPDRREKRLLSGGSALRPRASPWPPIAPWPSAGRSVD